MEHREITYFSELRSRAGNEWHLPHGLADSQLEVLVGNEVLVVDTFHSVWAVMFKALRER